MFIPDISYQLVFCFLPLNQLPIIARCSKRCRAIVTNPSFLNMFPIQTIIITNSIVTYSGPFIDLVRKLIIQKTINCRNETILLIKFRRLFSLEMTIDFHQFQEFNITPVFQELGPRLRELKVSCEQNSRLNTPNSFILFQKSLSLLNSLTSLKLFDHPKFGDKIVNDISFLSHMKKLQNFTCNCIHSSINIEILLSQITLLTDLSSLELDSFFPYSFAKDAYYQLKRFFVALENTNDKLAKIGFFSFMPNNEEFLHLFTKLNQLKEIRVRIIIGESIPTMLSKWIYDLELFGLGFSNENICEIIRLSNLKSLKLIRCVISNLKMKSLMNGLSSRLEELTIYQETSSHYTFSFIYLSECVNLKNLALLNTTHLDFDHFEILLNCKKLESIVINYCSNNMTIYDDSRRLSLEMHQALKIPSAKFPNLKKVCI
jgi:hypothetical protein